MCERIWWHGFIQLDDFSEMAEKVREIMKYEDGSKDHKRIQVE